MHSEYTDRIASHRARLAELLAATPLKYSDWPPPDISPIRESAGVYHFFEVHDGHNVSIYVGKGGFGGDDDWNLHSRLKQHFQPSQRYALLGKASKASGLSPEQVKARFEAGNLHVQWLALAAKSGSRVRNLEAELRWFECFAIAVLKPRYSDF